MIGMDQFAYKKHCNTTMALIKCQHNWLRWLDDDVDFVRVLSFDLSKAFDTVSHKIVCEKLRLLILIHLSSTGLLASLATANKGSLWMERLLIMLILTEECHRVQSLGHFYSL